MNNKQAASREKKPVRRWIARIAVLAAVGLAFCFVSLICACPPPLPSDVPIYTYEVMDRYPHDSTAWTQGLIYQDGVLYESTGLKGSSSLRRVDLATGKVLQSHALDSEWFAEGITAIDGRIFQLTWQDGIGFVYDKGTFEEKQRWSYSGEGWGITYDGTHLIMSDGTATLRFLDPDTFKTIKTLDISDSVGPVKRLNELEYINGEIYANVWQLDRIARISPQTGAVTGWIDLSGLLSSEEARNADVLNGITYDPATGRLLITGKYWPTLFVITLVEKKS